MKVLIVLAVITGILLWYALKGRDWFKSTSWGQRFLVWIEPAEIWLYKKSEMLIVARGLQAMGATLTFLTWIGQIDITPILPLVPEKYAGIVQAVFSFLPLVLNGLGAIVERLRNRTTKPIELVALPDKVVAENPKVAEAVAMADATKVEAVAVVATEAAKAA
jgi:hypothetical protein